MLDGLFGGGSEISALAVEREHPPRAAGLAIKWKGHRSFSVGYVAQIPLISDDSR